MKTKKILTILSVLIIFFSIISSLDIINYIDYIKDDLIIDEYYGYLVFFVLLYSIILSMLTLILVRLEKLLFFQTLFSIIIFGLNLGILIIFTIIIRDFWINFSIRETYFYLTSIVSIFCSILVVLFSYFQIKSKKHMKFSIEVLKKKILRKKILTEMSYHF